MIPKVAIVLMLQVHAPDGTVIDINPDQIVSLRQAPEIRQGHYPIEAHCLIHLADGKSLAVKEECEYIRQILGRDPGR